MAEPITREEIERWRTAFAEMQALDEDCEEPPGDFARLLAAAESSLSHPAALERARAEGVMEAYNAVFAIKHVDEGHARGLEDAEAALGPRPSPEAEAPRRICGLPPESCSWPTCGCQRASFAESAPAPETTPPAMTPDLRERVRLEIARAIGASMRMPNHMDRADDVLAASKRVGCAVVAAPAAPPEPAGNWRPMSEAPKNRPILAWCDHEADPHVEDEKTGRLTLYAAHAEGLSHASTGFHIVVWGGGVEFGEDEGGGYLPDWWFVEGSEWEKAANPVRWWELPARLSPPSEPAGDGWIAWGGDAQCPVPAGAPITVRLRYSTECITRLPETLRWGHHGWPDDIIAYRLSPPPSDLAGERP